MTFEWPVMLLSLLLIPLGVGLYLLIDRRRRARLRAAGGLGLRPTVASASRRLGGGVAAALFLLALIVLGIAVARPQAALSLPRSEGIVMLAFDVSGSMAADDLEPSRLDVAAEIAHAFVDDRPDGVIIGVVAFSEGGLSVEAPSSDEIEIRSAIDRLRPTLGTSMGQGMLASLEAIDRVESGTRSDYYSTGTPVPTLAPEPLEPGSHAAAVIVLLTDGENTAPPEPVEVAQVAADQGVRIHAVGVGTVEGTTLDTEDFRVHTQLDEPLLEHIAELTAGAYFPLDPDAVEITDTFDPADVYDSLGRQLNTHPEPMEVTSLFAAAGVLLLLGGLTISQLTSGRPL